MHKAHKRGPCKPAMSSPSLLARHETVRTHLHLDRIVRDEAAKNAVRRYGKNCSLSALVNALLARENALKGGLVNAKLRGK